MGYMCRLVGCSQAAGAFNASCPNCLKVPDSDLYSGLTDYSYCCRAHVLRDKDLHEERCKERQVHRTIVRAGAIDNKVFAAWGRTMSPYQILDERIISKTRREFVVGYSVDAPKIPLDLSVSHAGSKAVASYENCAFAVVLLAPLIAWSLQDLAVRIHEVDIEPKKACNVSMSIQRFGRYWIMEPADLHTVIQIQPKGSLDGVMVDTTSTQYLLPVRTHLKSKYQREKTITRHWSEGPFGELFERHEDKLKWLPLPDAEFALQNEASIRTINNVVLAEVEKFGGRQQFFDMAHVEFCQALLDVERKVEEALRTLRRRVDWALSHENYWHRLDRLQKIIVEADGKGYREMISVLPRNTKGG